MPEGYNPDLFLAIALSVHKGMHLMVPHAVLLLIPAGVAVALEHLRDNWRAWDHCARSSPAPPHVAASERRRACVS